MHDFDLLLHKYALVYFVYIAELFRWILTKGIVKLSLLYVAIRELKIVYCRAVRCIYKHHGTVVLPVVLNFGSLLRANYP